MVVGRKRAIVVIVAALLGAIGGSYFYSGVQVSHLAAVIRTQDQQARVQTALVRRLSTAILASCASAADIGGARVGVDPSTRKASKLGVQLVADFRAQWRKLGCPGVIPPPEPSFVHWARYYHLPSQ